MAHLTSSISMDSIIQYCPSKKTYQTWACLVETVPTPGGVFSNYLQLVEAPSSIVGEIREEDEKDPKKKAYLRQLREQYKKMYPSEES